MTIFVNRIRSRIYWSFTFLFFLSERSARKARTTHAFVQSNTDCIRKRYTCIDQWRSTAIQFSGQLQFRPFFSTVFFVFARIKFPWKTHVFEIFICHLPQQTSYSSFFIFFNNNLELKICLRTNVRFLRILASDVFLFLFLIYKYYL